MARIVRLEPRQPLSLMAEVAHSALLEELRSRPSLGQISQNCICRGMFSWLYFIATNNILDTPINAYHISIYTRDLDVCRILLQIWYNASRLGTELCVVCGLPRPAKAEIMPYTCNPISHPSEKNLLAR